MTNTHTAHSDGFMSAVQPLCDEPNRSPRSKGFIYFRSVLSSAIPEFENEMKNTKEIPTAWDARGAQLQHCSRFL